MVHLFHRAGGIADNTVVAKMVLQIVVIDGSRTVEGDIATVNQYLLQCPSFVYHITAIVYYAAWVGIYHSELVPFRIIGIGSTFISTICDTLRQIY